MLALTDTKGLRESLLAWYAQHRRPLLWRQTSAPYRIWISEIMLQQTRVETVTGYYERFLHTLPNVQALAVADEQIVLKLWEGLGYYSRARNLHAAAKMICEQYGGVFPADVDQLLSLPGVGSYTAGAIGSIAFGLRVPAIDGNVVRVTARCFGLQENVSQPSAQRAVRALQMELLPDSKRVGDFNQALMDLGATICTPRSPRCKACPWQESCVAHQTGLEETLPIHEKKQPPRIVHVAVCLLTHQNRVYVEKRNASLLKGMSVFLLLEGEHPLTQEEIAAGLQERGFADAWLTDELGQAQHVFTHRVWKMALYHYAVSSDSSEVGRFVNVDELAKLPVPIAMQAAKAAALRLLQPSSASKA